MHYVIGIDTGGTYTDSVLVDADREGSACVLKKAKAFTTHDQLEQGIRSSLSNLELDAFEIKQVEKVVLSTTLATNAIVENRAEPVGLILIGSAPRGELAAEYVKLVQGAMNIKGRVLENLRREEVEAAAGELLKKADAIAVSGPYSTRNPVLEETVREMIRKKYDVPVLCGHDLVHDLGYLERTNTVVINAGLMPIISRFVRAITRVLAALGIDAPVFVVRGDGSIATLEAIAHKPVDTVLSGPASSMTGTMRLTGKKNAIIADMGGTTTDCGRVRDHKVELSKEGASVGGWLLRISSARLHTFGLGGDSMIRADGDRISVGPRRVLPAARGGSHVTPTDLVHFSGIFKRWDQDKATAAVKAMSEHTIWDAQTFAQHAEEEILRMIYKECVAYYDAADTTVCAIGAPAGTWYEKARQVYGFPLCVPENFEVANAVGAAVSGIEEHAEVIVRPGEEGRGFLLHAGMRRCVYRNRMEAINGALAAAREEAVGKIESQHLSVEEIRQQVIDVFAVEGELRYTACQIDERGGLLPETGEPLSGEYIETRVHTAVRGRIFSKS